jgi:hypothetical protein
VLNLNVRGPMEGARAPGNYYVLFEDPDGIRLEVNFVPGAGLLASTPVRGTAAVLMALSRVRTDRCLAEKAPHGRGAGAACELGGRPSLPSAVAGSKQTSYRKGKSSIRSLRAAWTMRNAIDSY